MVFTPFGVDVYACVDAFLCLGSTNCSIYTRFGYDFKFFCGAVDRLFGDLDPMFIDLGAWDHAFILFLTLRGRCFIDC